MSPQIEAETDVLFVSASKPSVEITYAITGADAAELMGPNLRLRLGNGSGRRTLDFRNAGWVRIIAHNRAGTTEWSRRIEHLQDEWPDNDDTSRSQPIAGSRVRASISAADDWDFYRIDVPEGGHARFRLTDLLGNCPTGLRVHLSRAVNDVVDILPDGGCGAWRTPWDSPGAPYDLTVHGPAGLGYTVSAEVEAPECGNGILESRAYELCDDGNLMDGDRCTAMCDAIAQENFVGAPVASFTATGDIPSSHNPIYYRIELTRDANLTVTLNTNAGTCAADFALLDATLADVRRRSRCTPIEEALPAGVYYVWVSGHEGSQGAFELMVRIDGPVCGNGVRTHDEQCDDGNMLAGDGCSSSCTFEGPWVARNDFQRRPEIEEGRVNTRDGYFSVNIPRDHRLVAWLTPPSGFECADADLAVLSGVAEFAVDVHDEALGHDAVSGGCGTVEFAPGDVGTLFSQPPNSSDGAVVVILRILNAQSPGFVQLNVALEPPSCGNGLIELSEEECDDGNLLNGDGCNEDCSWDKIIEDQPEHAFLLPIPPGGRNGIALDPPHPNWAHDPESAPPLPWSNLRVRVRGHCGVKLELYNRRGRLVTETSSAVGPCPTFEPRDHMELVNLRDDPYYLHVVDLSAGGGTSEIDVDLIPGGCGNGIIDSRWEACDDGNTLDGDSCAADCRLVTPLETYVAPGPEASYMALAKELPALDIYKIQTTLPATVAASLDCQSEMRMELRYINVDGSVGPGVPMVRADGAPPSCPSIEVPLWSFNEYSLQVIDLSGGGSNPYVLHLSSEQRDGCGDGIVQTRLGERCDDGARESGDGCDQFCVQRTVVDQEPNDFKPQRIVPGVAPTQFRGSLRDRLPPNVPQREVDYDRYVFSIPAHTAASVSIRLRPESRHGAWCDGLTPSLDVPGHGTFHDVPNGCTTALGLRYDAEPGARDVTFRIRRQTHWTLPDAYYGELEVEFIP